MLLINNPQGCDCNAQTILFPGKGKNKHLQACHWGIKRKEICITKKK